MPNFNTLPFAPRYSGMDDWMQSFPTETFVFLSCYAATGWCDDTTCAWLELSFSLDLVSFQNVVVCVLLLATIISWSEVARQEICKQINHVINCAFIMYVNQWWTTGKGNKTVSMDAVFSVCVFEEQIQYYHHPNWSCTYTVGNILLGFPHSPKTLTTSLTVFYLNRMITVLNMLHV